MTGETVTVVLRGELDVTVEGSLYGRLSRIRDLNPSRLIFETAQVTYMDCSIARLIASTGDWLPAGVMPAVMSPSPIVRRVLLASGIGAFCQLGP